MFLFYADYTAQKHRADTKIQRWLLLKQNEPWQRNQHETSNK